MIKRLNKYFALSLLLFLLQENLRSQGVIENLLFEDFGLSWMGAEIEWNSDSVSRKMNHVKGIDEYVLYQEEIENELIQDTVSHCHWDIDKNGCILSHKCMKSDEFLVRYKYVYSGRELRNVEIYDESNVLKSNKTLTYNRGKLSSIECDGLRGEGYICLFEYRSSRLSSIEVLYKGERVGFLKFKSDREKTTFEGYSTEFNFRISGELSKGNLIERIYQPDSTVGTKSVYLYNMNTIRPYLILKYYGKEGHWELSGVISCATGDGLNYIERYTLGVDIYLAHLYYSNSLLRKIEKEIFNQREKEIIIYDYNFW